MSYEPGAWGSALGHLGVRLFDILPTAEAGGIPGSNRPGRKLWLGSYALSTSRDETGPGDHVGRSVLVPVHDVAAARAGKDALGQAEAVLGSRTAGGTVHGRVRRGDEAELPAVLGSHGGELSLGGGDGSVGRLLRHGRLGQELGREVLDCHLVEVAHHRLGPLATVVLALPRHLPVHAGSLALGPLVALRGLVAGLGLPPRHHLLVAGQLGGRRLAVLTMGEVEGVCGRRRDGAHAPVDADCPTGRRQRLVVHLHDEARPPVADRVLVHTDRARCRRERPRPHRAHNDPACEVEPELRALGVLLQGEPVLRVLERRLRTVPGLEPGEAASLGHRHPVLHVREGLRPCLPEVPDHLVLGDRGALSQPLVLASPPGHQLVELCGTARHLVLGGRGFVGLLRLLDALVPHPAHAVPLLLERTCCGLGDPQAVGVAHVSERTHVRSLPDLGTGTWNVQLEAKWSSALRAERGSTSPRPEPGASRPAPDFG